MNMSYCRFQNTSQDLQDCKKALSTMIEGENKEDKLGKDELGAAKSLASSCYQILEMLSEYAGKDLGEADEMDLEHALDDLNEACGDDGEED